ncbi:NADPH-dependent D-xylose reductase II,III [Smittium mucronatum]|uniref:NADPH-dependent D-xylose reductase II,III n=1 Tax=Smittium mucronatum TaxID=133383 RepID=A0A1R0H7R2_9FUNG|nr:NADPH-dependent D-xylose reductase II,III [Smittium mucronatum]
MSTTIKLSGTGQEMPLVGYGLWKVPKDVCKDMVVQAIKSGYRLLDGASDYGNELEVGHGIKEAISQGLVKREDLFVTGKLWCTHHRKEHVKLAINRSLADLGLEYLDLYLIHFPVSVKYVPIEERYPAAFFADPVAKTVVIDPVPYQETWQALEQLVDRGLVKNIGVSNIPAALLIDVLSYARIKPAVLQIEVHPYGNRAQLIQFAQTQGLAITGYSSFGDASYQSIGMVNQGADYIPLLEHPTVTSIASEHKVSPGQVLLRWAVQQNVAVVPKSLSNERISQNINIFHFVLSDDQMQSLNRLNINLKFNDPAKYLNYPIYAN